MGAFVRLVLGEPRWLQGSMGAVSQVSLFAKARSRIWPHSPSQPPEVTYLSQLLAEVLSTTAFASLALASLFLLFSFVRERCLSYRGFFGSRRTAIPSSNCGAASLPTREGLLLVFGYTACLILFYRVGVQRSSFVARRLREARTLGIPKRSRTGPDT